LLDLLAGGMNPLRASAAAGVSRSYAYGVHHKMGGVHRPPEAAYSSRYLDRDERYEIARLREAGLSVRKVAARLGRAPSTVSRELARNAGPRAGSYLPERAHQLAWRRQRRPKPSKLSRSPALRAAVQGMLRRRYSPEQASGRLKVQFPDDPSMRASHETIYQSLYIYPRGELKRELQACLRAGRDTRRRRGRGPEARGRIVGAVPIGQRPPEAEGRLVPGHHEGDLVMGSKASNSAVGTVVERTTGYLTLLHLPDGHTADAVAGAVIRRMNQMPAWFARTLTWDRGTEMARHQRVTAETGIQVYFRRPPRPLAARQQREPQRAPAGVPPQGHRPVPVHRRTAPGHRRRAQRPPPQALRLPHTPRATRYTPQKPKRCDDPLNLPVLCFHIAHVF